MYPKANDLLHMLNTYIHHLFCLQLLIELLSEAYFSKLTSVLALHIYYLAPEQFLSKKYIYIILYHPSLQTPLRTIAATLAVE